ncbi:MAG: precorrin-4 C(11)-methyltransferase [Rikenellaceae bacterium]
MSKYAIIITSQSSIEMARTISTELGNAQIISRQEASDTIYTESLSAWTAENFSSFDGLIFIGAIGIAVRCIASSVESKMTDPAVINIDSTGNYVVSLLSGHVGGANILTEQVAHIIGAQAVISTRSDCTSSWALDTLAQRWDWRLSYTQESINWPISTLVNGHSVALLLDIRDRGTDYLEKSKPSNVTIFYSYEDIVQRDFDLIIAVTPRIYKECQKPILYYHPKMLHLGVGCRRDCSVSGVAEQIERYLIDHNIAPKSIKSIATISLKKDEALMSHLQQYFKADNLNIYSSDQLNSITVANPSPKVEEVTGVAGVAESTAIASAAMGALLVEKQKGGTTPEANDFTFAVAVESDKIRGGHIEIVGAGPGDPDLVSVRGREMLQKADLILYAGSLVPIELTHCAKDGAVVRSSASMNLEEQFAIMKEFYDKGLFVVRLHTGDPCIYGAIQEQMAFFDKYQMSYHITPGISSFQAAAAELRSQFTIPEKVQTIILTRGEGRTAMPEKEKLHLLARSQSTMCIFLSASIVDQIQNDLLEHYAPTTPVAACYKLTWRDQKIFRGELQNLAHIVKSNNLTLTTMIVVGDAIDNREGLSKLYDDDFKHLFRK